MNPQSSDQLLLIKISEMQMRMKRFGRTLTEKHTIFNSLYHNYMEKCLVCTVRLYLLHTLLAYSLSIS
jgi:hypothetical protein